MRLNKYVDELAQYEGGTMGNWDIGAEMITGRTLKLAVPRGSSTLAQARAIAAARARATLLGVDFIVIPF